MQLVFDNTDSFSGKELSEFLFYFSAVYTVAVQKYDGISEHEIINNLVYYEKDFRSSLSRYAKNYTWKKRDPARRFFEFDLGNNEFLIERITKNSPLSASAKGMIGAMVLAVIISGGKISVLGADAEMQPLGVGIKLLKEAFYNDPDLPPETRVLPDGNPPMNQLGG